MMYLDLDEVDDVMSLSPLWSERRLAPARFCRDDFFKYTAADGSLPRTDSIDSRSRASRCGAHDIECAVRAAVADRLDFYPQGPVRLLTNLRYFGHSINPISCYYCFAADGKALQALLLEVTNTPWGERTCYVLDLREHQTDQAIDFTKRMHVSPFMPMDMMYRWRGQAPGATLRYSLSNIAVAEGNRDTDQQGDVDSVEKTGRVGESLSTEAGNRGATAALAEKTFDAGVNFQRIEISAAALNRVLLRYPVMTLKVAAGIYWQAVKLSLKGLPFVPHPKRAQP